MLRRFIAPRDRGGRYWGWHGFNLAGCIAMLVGMLVAAMTMKSPLYDGPLARALGRSGPELAAGLSDRGAALLGSWLHARAALPPPSGPASSTPAPRSPDSAGHRVRDRTSSPQPPSPSALHALRATPKTVHWGHFDASLAPVLTVRSGDLMQIEAITHHAGDDPDLMFDAQIEALFAGVPPAQRQPGPHIMTGPIYVRTRGRAICCRCATSA